MKTKTSFQTDKPQDDGTSLGTDRNHLMFNNHQQTIKSGRSKCSFSSSDSLSSEEISDYEDDHDQQVLNKSDYIIEMPVLDVSNEIYSKNCSDTYHYIQDLFDKCGQNHHLIECKGDDQFHNYEFKLAKKDKLLFYSNTGNIKQLSIDSTEDGETLSVLSISDLKYQFFQNFKLWTEDLMIVRLKDSLKAVKQCMVKYQFCVEIGSYNLSSHRTNQDSNMQDLLPLPEFGSDSGSIYIDVDQHTLAKLYFNQSEGFSFQCQYQNKQKEIGLFAAVNNKNQIWVYYRQSHNEEGFFRVLDQDNLQSIGNPIHCGNKRITVFKVSCCDNYVFAGNTHGELFIWDSHSLSHKKSLMHGHCQPVTCIAQFENLLATGADRDRAICIWNIEKGVLIYWIEFNHKILDMFLYGSKLLLCYDFGVQLIEGVYLKGYKSILPYLNVTSKNVEFFSDGDQIIVGCKQSILLKTTLSDYGDPGNEITKELENSIQTIQLNQRESDVFVSTIKNKYKKSNIDVAGIYQLDAQNFKVKQFYPCPNPFEFNHFKVIQTVDREKLITSGQFGLMVFDCQDPSAVIRIKEHQFTGINFDQHKGLIVAGTPDHIKFYQLDSIQDVNIHGVQIDKVIENEQKKEQTQNSMMTITEKLKSKNSFQKTINLMKPSFTPRTSKSLKDVTITPIENKKQEDNQQNHLETIESPQSVPQNTTVGLINTPNAGQLQSNQTNISEYKTLKLNGELPVNILKTLDTINIRKRNANRRTLIKKQTNVERQKSLAGSQRKNSASQSVHTKQENARKTVNIQDSKRFSTTSSNRRMSTITEAFVVNSNRGVSHTIDTLQEMLRLQTIQNYSTNFDKIRNDLLVKKLSGQLSDIAITNVKQKPTVNQIDQDTSQKSKIVKCKEFFKNICKKKNEQTMDNDFNQISSDMKFMAQGDSEGSIQIWQLDELDQNVPCAFLKYQGQIIDIKFIQNKMTNIMISLHFDPNQLIVTSLVNYKVIRKVNLQFQSRQISIHPNNRLIFLVPAHDNKLDLAVIDLGFKMHTKESHRANCMRDLMLISFLKGDTERQTEMLKVMLNSDNIACIDTLNSINILNVCANIHKNNQMKMLLQNQVLSLVDSRGKSISDYVIEKNNVIGTSLLFNFINDDQMSVEMATLMYGLKKDPLWISEYVQDKLFVPPKFMNDDEETILGHIHNRNEQCIFDSLSNFVSINLIKKHIDLNSNQKQEINIQVTSIPFNLESGSHDSISFLEQTNLLNDEAFYTDFAQIIQFKWKQDRKYAICLAVFHVIFVILLDMEILNMKSNYERVSARSYTILIFDIFFCLYEMAQMRFEGLLNYLQKRENYLDIFGQSFYIAYFAMQTRIRESDYSDDEDTEQLRLNFLCICVLLLNLRMALHLTVFSRKIRTMMTVIVSAIFDIIYFLFILYMFVMILALANFVVNGRKNLVVTIIEEYQLMFGENAEAEDIWKDNWVILVLYLAGTNLIVVVCLNILISIVQDKYDSVQLKMKATNFKHKAKILLANEKFMYWKRNMGAKKYLFLMQYETALNNSAVDVNWQGKVRMLKSNMIDVQNNIRQRIVEVERRTQQKIELVESKLTGQIQTVQDDVRKILNIISNK